MVESKFGLKGNGTSTTAKVPRKEPDQKKPRKVTVKNASFFLYEEDKESKKLTPMGAYQTETEICNAHGSALDGDIPEEQLVGFKGRFLKFEVRETKRRIAVK